METVHDILDLVHVAVHDNLGVAHQILMVLAVALLGVAHTAENLVEAPSYIVLVDFSNLRLGLKNMRCYVLLRSFYPHPGTYNA
jgi:hypothetical protein